MNVSKIKSFFSLNKKSFFYIGFFLFSFFLFSDGAFATEAKDIETKAIEGINFILVISAALLGAITSLISMFLTPEWVNGTIFGLDKYMRDIWILVSNLVYFIFAFILIVIAFMNIIGNSGDTWQLKSALPKFIVGVIMVPFTWFFVQFVLSISAILTVAVITLPYDSFNGDTDYQKAMAFGSTLISDTKNQAALDSYTEDKKDIPTTYILDLSQQIGSTNNKASGTDGENTEEGFIYEGDKKSMSDILKGDNRPGYENSVFGVLSLYTYGVMSIGDLDTANGGSLLSGIKTLGNLTLKLIFDAILIIVYLILMVALFLALLVRGIKLWVYAMFSPAFGLLYFFGKNDGVGEGNGKFGIKDFISLALVPVYVAGALSFGFLFLMVSSHGMHDGGFLKPCAQYDTIKENTEVIKEAECIGVGGFVFGIKGSIGDSNSGSDLSGSFGRLIMQLFGIVILWIAIMTALKQSEITDKITQPIQEFGGNVGNLIAKSPMYAPIIPSAGGLVSAKGLQKVGNMPQSALETRVAQRVGGYQEGFNKFFGGDAVDVNVQTRLRNAFREGLDSTELARAQDELRGLISKHGTDNNTVRALTAEFAVALRKGGTTLGKDIPDDITEDQLFAGGKISKTGYAMLHNEQSDSLTVRSTADYDRYAANSRNPNSGNETSKTKETSDATRKSETDIKLGDTTINIDASQKSSDIVKAIQDSGIKTEAISSQGLSDKLRGIGIEDDKKLTDILKGLGLDGKIDLDGDGDVDVEL